MLVIFQSIEKNELERASLSNNYII